MSVREGAGTVGADLTGPGGEMGPRERMVSPWGRVPTPALPGRARAHTVGLGHLLHEGARVVLHPARRLRVAAAGTGVALDDLSQTQSPRHTRQN